MRSYPARIAAACLGLVAGLSVSTISVGHGLAHEREAHAAEQHHRFDSEHHDAAHHTVHETDHQPSAFLTDPDASEHAHARLDAAVVGRTTSWFFAEVPAVAQLLPYGGVTRQTRLAPSDDVSRPDPAPRRRPPARGPPNT